MRRFLLLFAATVSCLYTKAQGNEPILLPPESITNDQPVGRMELNLQDRDRIDRASPTHTNRELSVQIWYPSQEKPTEFSPYISNLPAYSPLINGAEAERFGKVQLALSKNAPISASQEKYPVVLFSPGFGMNKAYYSSFCHYLAQNRFIVFAIDHPYLNKTVLANGTALDPQNGYLDSFPATQPASSVKAAKERFQEIFTYFKKDIDFIVTKLVALNQGKLAKGMFAGHLNLEKMAHLGHSGGALVTKALMSNKESDFDAFVTFDVRLDREFLSASEQIEIPLDSQKPILMFALEYVQQFSPFPTEDFLKNRKGPFHYVALNYTDHSAMTDLDYLYYTETKDIANKKMAEEKMDELFTITINFLKTYLQ